MKIWNVEELESQKPASAVQALDLEGDRLIGQVRLRLREEPQFFITLRHREFAEEVLGRTISPGEIMRRIGNGVKINGR